MRCSDAAIEPDHAEEHEPSTEPGEPPAVWNRRTPEEIFASIEHDLKEVQVLRLVDPEWLENLPGGARLSEIIAAFRARGGRVS